MKTDGLELERPLEPAGSHSGIKTHKWVGTLPGGISESTQSTWGYRKETQKALTGSQGLSGLVGWDRRTVGARGSPGDSQVLPAPDRSQLPSRLTCFYLSHSTDGVSALCRGNERPRTVLTWLV